MSIVDGRLLDKIRFLSKKLKIRNYKNDEANISKCIIR